MRVLIISELIAEKIRNSSTNAMAVPAAGVERLKELAPAILIVKESMPIPPVLPCDDQDKHKRGRYWESKVDRKYKKKGR